MRVTLMLCDHAVVAEGKLYIAGGGWSVTGPAPAPSAIALLFAVPWDQANHQHTFNLTLEREDGGPVLQRNELGQEQQVGFQADFEVGRPPGTVLGTPLELPLALNLPPLPLEPGARYQWVLEVDGKRGDEWNLPFTVRPAAHDPGAGPPQPPA